MEKGTVELKPLVCNHCGQAAWLVGIAHTSDGKTNLVLNCRSQECDNLRTPEGEEIQVIIEIDITGKGYDLADTEYQRNVPESELC